MMIFNKEREGGMVVTIILKNTVKAVRYNTCFMLFAFGFMVKLANFYLLRNKACLIFEVNCLILHDTCLIYRKRLSKYIFYSSFSLLTFATKK